MKPLVATYRLQLTPEQNFAFVCSLVPYLRELGISHLYLSPALQARSGSAHGYDVVDPTRVSDVLGGESGLRELAASGLGVILDIVPNHMGTGEENRWWPDPEIFDVNPATGFYRRFFDIDDLAAVRIEREEVFQLVHGKVLELVADGVLDGLRVDHPDGLADPAGYLDRLRAAVGSDVGIWVEKILHPSERLRAGWPVDGTVGYEFLNDVCALFVDPSAESALTSVYRDLTGEAGAFEQVALDAQLGQATGTFSRELDWLCALAPAGLSRDVIAHGLAALPVYRTYVRPGRVAAEDRAALAHVDRALAAVIVSGEPEEFVTRFQQTSPPVTAKGVEDTALYRYARLLALNEVGGEPSRFGLPVEEFHARNAERPPRGLLITQTHDTKRSGDVRARIGALASLADEWTEHVRRWFSVTDALVVDGAPDAQERYFLFQTLVGAWPIASDRLEAYVVKALREAKRNTTWVDQNTSWESRVCAFAAALLSHEEFLADFEPFAERVAAVGERHALGQLLLKLTSPGVPDIYQGDELEMLALVDPDNRRPVDWDARRRALESPDPPAKMHLIRTTLALRARRPDCFSGSYTPLDAGPDVCAFLRGDDVLVAVAVRGTLAPLDIPPGDWTDLLAAGDRHGLLLLERRR